MPSLGPGAEPSPPTRCGCCARPASAGKPTSSRPARSCARPKREPCRTPSWHEPIAELPDRPLLLVANEFLDALPIRQFVGGIERRDRDCRRRARLRPRRRDHRDLASARRGRRSDRRHLREHGGVALLIDYGHERAAPGDTLQAVSPPPLRLGARAARRAGPDLARRLRSRRRAAARTAGATVSGLVGQGEWLQTLGIEARAQALSRANPDRLDELNAAIDRLCGARRWASCSR